MCHFRRTPGNGASDGRVEQPMYLQFRYFATKILWPKIRRIRQHGFTFLYIMIFNLSFPTVAALYPQLSNGRVSDPNPIISEVLSCFLSRPRLYLRRTELIKSEPVPSTYQRICMDMSRIYRTGIRRLYRPILQYRYLFCQKHCGPKHRPVAASVALNQLLRPRRPHAGALVSGSPASGRHPSGCSFPPRTRRNWRNPEALVSNSPG